MKEDVLKKDVLIKIKGMQGNIIDQDEIEVVTTGFMYKKNNSIYVSYIDNYLDSGNETQTTIKIKENKVSLTRYGAINTHLIFETGKEHYTPYETPFGIIDILSDTKKIEIKDEKKAYYLKVEYNLQINQVSAGTTYFELSVKELDKNV